MSRCFKQQFTLFVSMSLDKLLLLSINGIESMQCTQREQIRTQFQFEMTKITSFKCLLSSTKTKKKIPPDKIIKIFFSCYTSVYLSPK